MTMTELRVGSLRHNAAPRTAFSASWAIAGILETLAAATPDPHSDISAMALRRWAGLCAAGSELSLREGYARLNASEQAALQRRLGARLEELLSLSEETDPRLLGEGIAAMAGSSLRAGDAASASLLYGFLAQVTGPLGPQLGAAFRARAETEARALRGEGAFGARFEHLARGFARQASDPTLIAGMGVGSLVAGAVRLGVLSRLASAPTASFFTRGIGASWTAGTAAWAAEVPAFWMTTRALHAATSETPLAWDRATLTRELAATGMMLGLLKIGGAASTGAFNRVHGISPLAGGVARLAPFTRWSQPLFAQAGMLAGIYADHLLEERLGWRPDSDPTSRVFDSFATLLQFHVGGRLASTALGPRYATAIRELETRSRLTEIGNRPGPFSNLGRNGEPIPAFAGGRIPRPGSGEGESPLSDFILAMSQLKPGGPRSPRGRSAKTLTETAVPQVSRDPLQSGTENLVPEAEPSVLRTFYETPANRIDRFLKELHEREGLAGLALELEAGGLRPDLSPADAARARERLRALESDFWNYLNNGREAAPIAGRWEIFQRWQNELVPKGFDGFAHLTRRLQTIGAGDISALKTGEVRMKNRVRDNPEAADYFLDLSLVREFLRTQGLHRVDEANPNGRYLSHLLLNGDGNCVTLSLLFAHLAVKTGWELQVGLMPRHTYLTAREGAAIESILDFGITSASAYRNRAIGPEQKPLPPYSLLGLHLLNLGKSSLERGQIGEAKAGLERARDILPRSPRADFLLAQLAQRQGDLVGAALHHARVFALHPNDARGLNQLRAKVWERFIAQQYGEAEQIFRRINDLDPEDLDALAGLELTYRRMDRTREADDIANLIEVLRLGPEEP